MVEALPSNLGYFQVIGQYLAADILDGDADGYPDGYPLDDVTVWITPTINAVKDLSATPNPVTLELRTQSATFDSAGYLLGKDGERGVWLLSPTDANLASTNWSYRIAFRRGGKPVKGLVDFTLRPVDAGEVVDLGVEQPSWNVNPITLSAAELALAEAEAALAASMDVHADALAAAASADAADTSATDAAASAIAAGGWATAAEALNRSGASATAADGSAQRPPGSQRSQPPQPKSTKAPSSSTSRTMARQGTRPPVRPEPMTRPRSMRPLAAAGAVGSAEAPARLLVPATTGNGYKFTSAITTPQHVEWDCRADLVYCGPGGEDALTVGTSTMTSRRTIGFGYGRTPVQLGQRNRPGPRHQEPQPQHL